MNQPLRVAIADDERDMREFLDEAMRRLGHQVVAVAATGRPLSEYSALEIKKAVTGYGQAEKQQVNTMVKALLNVEEEVETDASDALAAAICHLNTRMFQKAVEESAGGGKR